MANLKMVADAIFTNKVKWCDISDEEKEGSFFIINRMFSKKYPEKAQLLNIKGIDKVSSMDLWYHLMKGKAYPKWFWSKTETNKSELGDSERRLLKEKLNITDFDLDYLLKYHPDFISEELNYFKKLQKQ
jgi:hypothetical protein